MSNSVKDKSPAQDQTDNRDYVVETFRDEFIWYDLEADASYKKIKDAERATLTGEGTTLKQMFPRADDRVVYTGEAFHRPHMMLSAGVEKYRGAKLSEDPRGTIRVKEEWVAREILKSLPESRLNTMFGKPLSKDEA